jgi:hypothetical protein
MDDDLPAPQFLSLDIILRNFWYPRGLPEIHVMLALMDENDQ